MKETYPLVEKIYCISENIGGFMGTITANLLNSSTFIALVGLNALKKSNKEFLEKSEPAYTDSKKKIYESVNELIPESYKKYFDIE